MPSMILPAPSTIARGCAQRKTDRASARFSPRSFYRAYTLSLFRRWTWLWSLLSLFAVTGFAFVLSVVVVLVCANAIGAIIAQASVIMLFFIFPSVVVIASDLIQGTAADKMRPFPFFDWQGIAAIRANSMICPIEARATFAKVLLVDAQFASSIPPSLRSSSRSMA